MKKPNRQIRSITMKPDLSHTSVEFEYAVEGEEEDDDVVSDRVASSKRPNKEFIDAMKLLRKLALDICESTPNAKEFPMWRVTTVKIAGSIALKTARVSFKLSKGVERTAKEVLFGPTPQITMYPEKEDESRYLKAEELAKLVEKVCDEALAYADSTRQLELELV